jgi:hypothetical protein
VEASIVSRFMDGLLEVIVDHGLRLESSEEAMTPPCRQETKAKKNLPVSGHNTP